MKKIIIAIFIVIATLGIAAGTTAKKAPVKTTSKTTTTTKKSTSTPKKEVTDPYVGWWFSPYDEVYDEATAGLYDDNDLDKLLYVTKENGKYYTTQYQDFPREKGARLCKEDNGLKFEITAEELKIAKTSNKRATKEQVERLKYNMENAVWLSKKFCDSID